VMLECLGIAVCGESTLCEFGFWRIAEKDIHYLGKCVLSRWEARLWTRIAIVENRGSRCVVGKVF